ncbi:MAG: AMP-binding protein [Thermosynechococcaceae cyanobacterium]
MNLAQLLSETAAQYPDKSAVIFEETVWTYRAFDEAVERYAALLCALGIQKGDRVALQLPKSMEFLWFHFAILSLGAVTLPLNPDYRPDETTYFLTDSGSVLYVADGDRYRSLDTALQNRPELRVVLVDAPDIEGVVHLAEQLEQTPSGFQRPYPTEGQDVAMICYTSGTTGRSKGAMISHRNLVSNLLALSSAWEWTDKDVLLHVLPLFHVHGLNVAVHGSLYAGATLILQKKFAPRAAWTTLETAQCTQLMAVPTIYQRLLQSWETFLRKPNISAMRLFISGSGPLSETQFLRFEQVTGFRILERYGMTETGMIASNPIDPAQRQPKSVGFPLPGVEIRIVGVDGTDVVPGEVGEVWIWGDNVFLGYWQMPEKTQEAFVDGWFCSGDLGFQDPQDSGRLYLVGRSKEVIISGGLNVYPKEVEQVLERHDAVVEAAVVGLPDEDLGEQVAANIVLRRTADEIHPEQLMAHCKTYLASYKCPKYIIFTASLPRNAMGKIQRDRVVGGLQIARTKAQIK